MTTVSRSFLAVVLVVVALLVPAGPAGADPAYLTLEATYTSVANGWAKVDRYLDTTAGFHAEQYPPDGRGDQDGQRRTFFAGVGRPSSARFLLYSAPGWATGGKATPVLLVHGANDNPDRAWANPNESGGFGCGSVTCPSTGLMQYLDSRGYRVFAIGFAHKQGDNLQQAQQVGDAIAIIKARLGVSAVDVVGWSKGEMSSRMYVSSVKPSWGRSYAGDVRKLITLGGPNGGYDYPFAHGWSHDFSIWPECGGTINAPSPHTRMTCYGQYTYHPELSITPTGGWDAYPGQRQMLARWDGTFGVNTSTQDWYTTYYGGQGFYTDGPGIQAAINAGSLISTIQNAGTPPSVSVYLLAGGAPNIVGVWNETRGPSDGIVFVASALSTTGVSTVAGTALIPTANHLQLGWSTASMAKVVSWLSRRRATRGPSSGQEPMSGTDAAGRAVDGHRVEARELVPARAPGEVEPVDVEVERAAARDLERVHVDVSAADVGVGADGGDALRTAGAERGGVRGAGPVQRDVHGTHRVVLHLTARRGREAAAPSRDRALGGW